MKILPTLKQYGLLHRLGWASRGHLWYSSLEWGIPVEKAIVAACRMLDKGDTITIQHSGDPAFYSQDESDDCRDYIEAFVSACLDAVRAAYPCRHVESGIDWHNSTEASVYVDAGDDTEDVRRIIQRVWDRQEFFGQTTAKLTTITAWDGNRDAIGVRDESGQVWWPSESTQDEIQSADNPQAAAVRICQSQPMRGTWQA